MCWLLGVPFLCRLPAPGHSGTQSTDLGGSFSKLVLTIPFCLSGDRLPISAITARRFRTSLGPKPLMKPAAGSRTHPGGAEQAGPSTASGLLVGKCDYRKSLKVTAMHMEATGMCLKGWNNGWRRAKPA